MPRRKQPGICIAREGSRLVFAVDHCNFVTVSVKFIGGCYAGYSSSHYQHFHASHLFPCGLRLRKRGGTVTQDVWCAWGSWLTRMTGLSFSAAWRLAGPSVLVQGYLLPGIKVKLTWNHARG